MITAILDTNVFVQATFSPPQSASYRTIIAHENGRYQLIFSPETLDEFLQVLSLPRIRDRHGWSDDQIRRFVLSFLADAVIHTNAPAASATVTRDVTDTKFLGLAEASGANFLVTNDHRHLLPIGKYRHTRIVTPAKFLRELP